MTMLERIRETVQDTGLDHVYMFRAPDILRCVTITPYMSSPLSDIPMSSESYQVAVRSDDANDARRTAWAAFRAVDEDSEIHAVFRQTPTFLGLEDGRVLYVFNFDVIASWDELIEESGG